MANLKIKNAPLIPNDQLESSIKIPTGGKGNYSVNLGQIAQFTKNSLSLAVQADVDRLFNEKADKSNIYTKLEVDERISLGQGGVYGFKTYTDFLLVKDNIPANSIVTILEEGQYQGDNVWDGQVLTPSPYDPLAQAKEYTDTKLLDKADKNSVYLKSETYNNQEVYNKGEVYSKDETFNKTEVNTVVSTSKSSIENSIYEKIIQNGAALPFDETVDYAEGAFTVKDGSLQQFLGGVWKKPTQTADQIFDESGKTQQELNDKLKRGYVTPYDFGYADGLDYGYYLQLAIDSGKTVMGSYKKEDQVRVNTAVYITNDTQQVDCSMIQAVESYIEQGDTGRLKGFINLQPKVLNQLNWINATSIPEIFSNAITLESTVGLSVGDYVIISTRHAIEDFQSKTGFITGIIGNTILTNYIFGTIPTTLRVAKSNYVKGNVIKAPQRMLDKITETQDTSKMIGGIVANRAVEYKISGTNLIEGANPTFLALHCHNGQDYGMQNTRPRVTGGGQGYAVQINHSTYCKSYAQRSVKCRHLVDFTGGGWNDAYNGIAIDPVHTAIGTHGNYEHDCNFHNMRTNTAIGV